MKGLEGGCYCHLLCDSNMLCSQQKAKIQKYSNNQLLESVSFPVNVKPSVMKNKPRAALR